MEQAELRVLSRDGIGVHLAALLSGARVTIRRRYHGRLGVNAHLDAETTGQADCERYLRIAGSRLVVAINEPMAECRVPLALDYQIDPDSLTWQSNRLMFDLRPAEGHRGNHAVQLLAALLENTPPGTVVPLKASVEIFARDAWFAPRLTRMSIGSS